MTTLRDRLAVHRALAGQLISLANLLNRPVLDKAGTRVGRVSDVVVRWEEGVPHPPVTAVLVGAGNGYALVAARDVSLEQSEVRLLTDQTVVARPVRREGDVALARDVLDRQLVDVAGVQVVRAADIYLVEVSEGWELGGIDVGQWSLVRRLLPRRRICPPPDRLIDWADLQAFVPRFSDSALPGPVGPAAAAGTTGSGIKLGSPARAIRRLRAKQVAAIISDLGPREQAQVAALAAPSAAAAALRELDPAKRDAILAELDADDRARLLALLNEDDAR